MRLPSAALDTSRLLHCGCDRRLVPARGLIDAQIAGPLSGAKQTCREGRKRLGLTPITQLGCQLLKWASTGPSFYDLNVG